MVDFSFIRPLCRPFYSHTGRPSVDPVVLFKMLLIGYLYGITSERRLARELSLNLGYRWFLGYDFDQPTPDHSVLSKALARFGPEVFETFFRRSIDLCREAGLLEEGPVYVDMPGYGGSDPVARHAPNNALALKLFMDALGIEKAALVGNSMGGGATLTFAVEYNDRISHIVTMGHAPVGNIAYSWPGGPGFGPTTEGLKVLAETRREPTVENFRRLISALVYDDSFVSDELLQQRVKQRTPILKPSVPTR